MQLNDNELKLEKYAHGRQMKLIEQIACATKPPMTPSNNLINKETSKHHRTILSFS